MSYSADDLYKAHGLFVEAIRPYVVSVMMKEHGQDWEPFYVETLYNNQKGFWHQQREMHIPELTDQAVPDHSLNQHDKFARIHYL